MAYRKKTRNSRKRTTSSRVRAKAPSRKTRSRRAKRPVRRSAAPRGRTLRIELINTSEVTAQNVLAGLAQDQSKPKKARF